MTYSFLNSFCSINNFAMVKSARDEISQISVLTKKNLQGKSLSMKSAPHVDNWKENHIQELVMIMINCFWGIIDRRKAISIASSRDLCQRFSPSRISDLTLTWFEPALKLSSNVCRIELCSCVNHYTTAPSRSLTHFVSLVTFCNLHPPKNRKPLFEHLVFWWFHGV